MEYATRKQTFFRFTSTVLLYLFSSALGQKMYISAKLKVFKMDTVKAKDEIK